MDGRADSEQPQRRERWLVMTILTRNPPISCTSTFPHEQYTLICSTKTSFTPKQLSQMSRFLDAYDNLLRHKDIGCVVDIDVKAYGVCLVKLATNQDSDIPNDLIVHLLADAEINESAGFYKDTGGPDFVARVRRCLSELCS